MHAYFASLQSGIAVNGKTITTAFLGGIFGLDGIHPTNTGYALVANQFIAALNTSLALSIPPVDVDSVGAKDPLFKLPISSVKHAVRYSHLPLRD
jgi:hypothetical protein